MSDFVIPLILCLIIVAIMVPMVANSLANRTEMACQAGQIDPGLCQVIEVAGLTTPAVSREGETP